MDPLTLQLLKNRYFELALQESHGKTPEITEELDKIEQAIKRDKALLNQSPPLALDEGLFNK